MLCVVGDLVEDVIVRRRGPWLDDTDNEAEIVRHRGGSAANVAAAAARFGAEQRSPIGVRFVGRVGDDVLGEALVAELVAEGVDVHAQRAGRTGTIVVIVGRDGQRTMFPDRAAAAELDDIDEASSDGVTWLHVPAYSLVGEPVASTVAAFVRRARSGGATISVDLSSIGLIDGIGRDAFTGLLEEVAPDVVVATAEEVARLSRTVAPLTVVKDGPRPVRVLTSDREDTVEVPPVDDVVDTTGAGDAFAAGYVMTAAAGADPVTAARAGIALAARTIRHAGARLT